MVARHLPKVKTPVRFRYPAPSVVRRSELRMAQPSTCTTSIGMVIQCNTKENKTTTIIC